MNSLTRSGVEAKPRPGPSSELDRAELDLVLVDEGAVAAEEAGDGVSVEELGRWFRQRVVEVVGEESGEALKEVVIEEFCVEPSESVEAVFA